MARLTPRTRFYATACSGVAIVLTLLGALAATIAAGRSQAQSTLTDRYALRVEYSADFVGGSLASLAEHARTVASRYLDDSPAPARLALVCGAFGFDRCDVVRAGAVVAGWGPQAGLAPPPGVSVAHSDGTGLLAVWGWSGTPSGAHVALGVAFGAPGSREALVAALPLADTPLAGFLHRVVTAGRAEVLVVSPAGGLIDSSPAVVPATLTGYSPRLAAAARSASSGAFTWSRTRWSFQSAPVPGTGWRLVVAEPSAELYAAAGGLQATVPWIVFAVVAVLASALLAVFLRVLAGRRSMQDSWAQMEEDATTDPLTGLANRRQLEAALRRLAKGSEPYSVMMIDLDHFKQVNDRYGHAAGDRVLRQLAELMRATFRDSDVFGRWGGDEFLAVLPGAGAVDATDLAARLQRATHDVRALMPAHAPAPRITIGTSTSGPGIDVVAAADRALYAAKAARRPLTVDVGA